MSNQSNDLVSNWLDALRGGEYRQTTGVLRCRGPLGNSYCCLGVLREVADGCGVQMRRATTSDHLDSNDANAAIGLTYEEQRRLSNMNDDGHSFAEIADYIQNLYRGRGFALFREATLTALKDLT